MNCKVDGPRLETGKACEHVLRALPKWFGIEEAIVHYVQAMDELPTFIAEIDERIVGFVSVKLHFEHAAEIYVMGILPLYHRQGLGRALMNEVEKYCFSSGVEFLQVKTLSPSRESREYEQTRQFYSALGFKPVEEFPTLWGPESPCLMMIKNLGSR